MSCPEFEEPIARYVGGDLSAEEALAVELHLRNCVDCAELAREMEDDRAWVSQRPPELVEVDFAAMRREIRREIGRTPRWRRWLPALLAAAAILLVFVAVSNRRKTPALPVALVPAVAPVEAVKSVTKAARPEPGLKAAAAATVEPETGITLEAAIRMFQELEHPAEEAPPEGSDSPVEMRIATRDPNVTIILLQESKGDSQ
jgi:anti-sigma factor RsiW